MINDDLSEDIKQVFYNLINGEKSRDEAAAWANSVLAEDKLAVLPSAHVDALGALGMVVLKGGPNEGYLYDIGDFRDWLNEFLNSKAC